MDLVLPKSLTDFYHSNSQKTRVMTEAWALQNVFCPSCGGSLNDYENNRPVADFYCTKCNEDYELKSKRNSLGNKIADGAYSTMINKVNKCTNPSFFFLTYDKNSLLVNDLMVVPSHFFTESIIEKRKPLADTAKRAGWVGCNILYNQLPSEGKIFYIRSGIVETKSKVVDSWNKTVFLRDSSTKQKGWLLDIMQVISKFSDKSFSLNDLYQFENYFKLRHPNNNNIQDKIRQQLQMLRDKQYLRFVSRGRYEVV